MDPRIVLGALLVAAGASAVPARAATITVDGSSCTLADAIRSANDDSAPLGSGCADGAGADIIVLDQTETITVPEAAAAGASSIQGGPAGLPDVTSAITLQAGAATVVERVASLGCADASPVAFRLFNVLSGADLTLVGITLRNGCVAAAAGVEGRGGAVVVDGGALTMTGGGLEGNRARGGAGTGIAGGMGKGGAIAAVGASSTATLTGVLLSGNTARGGDSDTTGGSADGGAVHVDLGSLTMDDCELTGNDALGGDCADCFGGTATGGAIRIFTGNVSLQDSMLVANTATGGEGQGASGIGGPARGGAIGLEQTGGTLERLIVREDLAVGGASTLVAGSASGGALWVLGNAPALRDSLLTGNTARGGGAAGGAGGGVYFAAAGGEIHGCTFSGNLAEGLDGSVSPGPGLGGGLYATGSGTMAGLISSTFSGNTARGGDHTGVAGFGADGSGGGVYILKDVDQVTHLTVVGNATFAGDGPSVDGDAQGGGLFIADNVTIDDVLSADNTVTAVGGGASDEDCYRSNAGVIASLGYNLVEAPDPTCSFAAAGDQTGSDPQVHPLGDYGCATPLPDGTCLPTVALPAASLATDAGSCAVSGQTTDSRGVARPRDVATQPDVDDGCDTGAFELLPGAFHTLTPCRLVDTRGADAPALTSGIERTWTLAGLCGIPANATAVALNATVTAPTGGGHLTLYPGGAALPSTSTLNFSVGQTRANNAVLSLAADGSGALSARAVVPVAGTVHLILDVSGYFE